METLRTSTLHQPFADLNTQASLKRKRAISKTKQTLGDRFIPRQTIHQNQNVFFNDSSEDGTQPSHFQNILKQQLTQQSIRQPQHISSYQNKNLLRFQPKKCTQSTPGAIWLGGLQIRQSLLKSQYRQRKIRQHPLKVLQAPALQDDFYLNLLDWSPQDQIAVGLASRIYLWNPQNAQVSQLCEMPQRNSTTSVGYSQKQPLLAIGTQSGMVQVWDVVKSSRVRSFGGHSQRVGSISWGKNLLSTGSRDKSILLRDIRCEQPYVTRLLSHTEEVCGLKWSFDDQQLSSGGNDNSLFVWSNHSNQPLHTFKDHRSAVKALAWSPHQHSLLASGGGTADKTIKFRNTLTGQTLNSWDVGSQVCNLAFSRTLNELVSTHGYCQNQIAVWDCTTMKRVVSLKGHTYRVLYLAMSPDGSTAVTGAGDQTLRFWELFPSSHTLLSEGQLQECSSSIR